MHTEYTLRSIYLQYEYALLGVYSSKYTNLGVYSSEYTNLGVYSSEYTVFSAYLACTPKLCTHMSTSTRPGPRFVYLDEYTLRSAYS